MITFVEFVSPVVVERFGATMDWSRDKHLEHGIENAPRIECEDKGNCVVLSWTSTLPNFKGRKMRRKVSLANVRYVAEMDPVVETKK